MSRPTEEPGLAPPEPLTPQAEGRLLDAARAAADLAYAPYSDFRVGAALLTLEGDRVITGANLENAAYGPTICAERAALARANVEGHRLFRACAIVAAGPGEAMTTRPTLPCGVCRQMLFEAAQLAGRDILLLSATTDRSQIVRHSLAELLPHAFGPADLGIDLDRWRRPAADLTDGT